ncbi:MAG: triose-phosphate isomerase [Clostridia bacterium]|nr:triose-phosphate isomerase [Clostridia bacterium]MBR3553833.1 triose-phosphate isomerase [Clostridia bacterium]
MKKSVRKAVIAGNWKMNNTPAQTTALINEMKPLVAGADCEVVLCVPFVDIAAAVEAAKGSNIKIGAENVHFKASGAYTGEVSADMLVASGVEYVVIGHSERRQYFGETDQTVNLRSLAALNAGLKAIICVGETLEQRELGYTETLLKYQTKMALTNVTKEQLKNVIIAYEPVWAIGTGVTATADQADEGNGFVRAAIAEAYGADAAETVTVQYGGSMNAKNAEELVSKVNVDGGLIGGASLKAADFSVIVKAASEG